MRPEKIYVTSNYHPKEIFTDKSILQALCDRFNIVEIVKLKPVDDGVEIIRPALKRARKNVSSTCTDCYTSPCGCIDVITVDPVICGTCERNEKQCTCINVIQ